MKRIFLALLVTLFALVLGRSAFANSVSLTSEFRRQNRYNISVNGSSAFSTMMSNALPNRIHAEETWTAPQTSLLPGIASGGVQTVPNSAHASLVLNTPRSSGPGCAPHALIAYSPVPEPGSLTLLGTGLIGLATVIRRKFAQV